MMINRHKKILVTSSITLLFINIFSGNIPPNQSLKKIGINPDFNSKALAIPAAATKGIEYKPPSRGAPSTTASGGARVVDWPPPPEGGNRIKPAFCSFPLLVSLVPENHFGLTTSGYPTFLWYVTENLASEEILREMEFELKQVGKNEPIYKDKIPVERKPAIVQIQLPKNSPQMVTGQEYVWSVSTLCVANGEIKKMMVQSSIRRVAPTPALTRLLGAAKSEREQASAYAVEGFWYDAVATLVKAADRNPDDRAIAEDFYSLLDQVGLNEVTAKVRQ
ncbi:MAG TPA: DUF928 domain-containing protein [Leptolyngbyaceae cyanobacterium]